MGCKVLVLIALIAGSLEVRGEPGGEGAEVDTDLSKNTYLAERRRNPDCTVDFIYSNSKTGWRDELRATTEDMEYAIAAAKLMGKLRRFIVIADSADGAGATVNGAVSAWITSVTLSIFFTRKVSPELRRRFIAANTTAGAAYYWLVRQIRGPEKSSGLDVANKIATHLQVFDTDVVEHLEETRKVLPKAGTEIREGSCTPLMLEKQWQQLDMLNATRNALSYGMLQSERERMRKERQNRERR